MGEIRINLTEVDMVCDDCGDGRMRPTATVLKEYPPKYIHMCDNCCKLGSYDKIYPYREDEHIVDE